MSLKQFLVVGKSFADAPREKSPFDMHPDIRLPKFENAPRFTTKQPLLVQTDWLAEKEHRAVEPKGSAVAKKRARRSKRNRSWLEILTFGFLGKKEPAAELVQEEMVLENVRVLRNDLADSDLEVVVNKDKKFTMRKVQERGHSSPPGNGEAVKVEEAGPKAELISKNEVSCERECPRSNPVEKKVRWPRPKKQEEWSELTVRLFEIGQH